MYGIKLCLLMVLVGTVNGLFAQQEDVFYSIRRGDSHLVTIDTLGNVTDIGYIGFNIGTPSTIPLDFDRCGRLIMLRSNEFYQLDLQTGLATSISTLTGVSGSGTTFFTFGTANQLFVFREITSTPQGSLYAVDLNTGVATLIGASGTPSILGVEANESGTIFGFEESTQKLVYLNPATGAMTSQASGSLGIVYPVEVDFNIKKGQLWGFDIVATSSTTIQARSVNLSTGVSTLRFTLPERYVGMATYTASVVTPRPTTATSGPNRFCEGSSVTLTASVSQNVLWSNGETTQSITTDTAGAFYFDHTDALGCVFRSVDTVAVTVDTTIVTILNKGICEYGNFEGYNITGTYRDTFVAANGCDSVRVLNLTVTPYQRVTDVAIICSGDNYLGYTTTGIYYVDTIPSDPAPGCDIILILDLTVLPPNTVTITQTICNGQSYDGYTATGTYVDTFTVMPGNCDSIRTLHLTVLPVTHTSESQTICFGDSYQGHTATGVYYDTTTTANGCDSIHTLNLTVLTENINILTQTICDGQSYEGYYVAGTYRDTFSANGCDSIRVLVLEVDTVVQQVVSVSICEGDTFAGYTATGVYTDTFATTVGCDSIVTLKLNVAPLPEPVIGAVGNELSVADTFASYQWYLDGNLLNGEDEATFTAASNGNYTVVVTNAAGCMDTAAVFNVTGIGIDETLAKWGISIYPNPTTGKVYFDWGTTADATWAVYDGLGREVLSGKATTVTEIDLSNRSVGIYYVRVTTANGIHTTKLVLAR